MLVGENLFDYSIASCILKKGKETNTNKYYSIRAILSPQYGLDFWGLSNR